MQIVYNSIVGKLNVILEEFGPHCYFIDFPVLPHCLKKDNISYLLMTTMSDASITEEVLKNEELFSGFTYLAFMIIMVVFAGISDILAFIFTREPLVALIWDVIYGILAVIGIIGLSIYNLVLLYIFSVAFIADAIVALAAIIAIVTDKFKFDIMSKGGSIGTFSFFCIIQLVFFIIILIILDKVQTEINNA